MREDPLAPAEIIVVLSGGMPYRAEEGGRLYKMGEAPEVWITRPDSPTADMQRLGVQYVGEEQYSREVLVHLGVPESAVHVLPDVVINTEQEMGEIAREMRKEGKTRVIIVTSPPHTRRVKTLWTKLVDKDLHAEVRAAFEDPFDRDRWWRNTHDAYAVVREVLGLINAWTGLLVRPSTH